MNYFLNAYLGTYHNGVAPKIFKVVHGPVGWLSLVGEI